MGFNIFRRKPASWSQADAILRLSNLEFARHVKSAISEEPPNAHAMILVAYEKTRIGVLATEQVWADRGVSVNFDDSIRTMLNDGDDRGNEIRRRRRLWGLSALFLIRLNRLAQKDVSIRPITAEIWGILALSGQVMKSVLADNIVWTEEDKWSFAGVGVGTRGIAFILDYIMPRFLREEPTIHEFARSHGIKPEIWKGETISFSPDSPLPQHSSNG
jgi:hypothetical protein